MCVIHEFLILKGESFPVDPPVWGQGVGPAIKEAKWTLDARPTCPHPVPAPAPAPHRSPQG